MTTLTAAIVLERFDLTTADFSAVATEYLIDDVIDYINLEAGTSISNLAGVAGAKTVTVTSGQNAAIKLILSLMLKDVKAMATSTSQTLGQMSMSESISESVSQASIGVQGMIDKALKRLTGMALKRT